MDRSSLKSHFKERDKHKKETEEGVKTLAKTEKEVVGVADQVGRIKSDLSDIAVQISAARSRILDSGAKAGEQDSAKLNQKEQAAAGHQRAVDKSAKLTKAEQQDASKIKPKDSRIKDGGELTAILQEAGKQLEGISSDLQKDQLKGAKQRDTSQKAISDAVRRNRK